MLYSWPGEGGYFLHASVLRQHTAKSDHCCIAAMICCTSGGWLDDHKDIIRQQIMLVCALLSPCVQLLLR